MESPNHGRDATSDTQSRSGACPSAPTSGACCCLDHGSERTWSSCSASPRDSSLGAKNMTAPIKAPATLRMDVVSAALAAGDERGGGDRYDSIRTPSSTGRAGQSAAPSHRSRHDSAGVPRPAPPCVARVRHRGTKRVRRGVSNFTMSFRVTASPVPMCWRMFVECPGCLGAGAVDSFYNGEIDERRIALLCCQDRLRTWPAVRFHVSVDVVGDVALECSQRLLAGLAFSALFGHELLG
jgi:hypothetical protein